MSHFWTCRMFDSSLYFAFLAVLPSVLRQTSTGINGVISLSGSRYLDPEVYTIFSTRKYLPYFSRRKWLCIFIFSHYYVLKDFFNVDHFLSLYWICFIIASIMFGFFGHEACGISGLWPGMGSVPPALESEVLTMGWPRKSPDFVYLMKIYSLCSEYL